MYSADKYIKRGYIDFINDNKDEIKRCRSLIIAIDMIEYRVKKNGKQYAKTEDNFIYGVYKNSMNYKGIFCRCDRGYKWLDINGYEYTDLYMCYSTITIDLKQPLCDVKKEISRYRKNLANRLQTAEENIKISYDDFINNAVVK